MKNLKVKNRLLILTGFMLGSMLLIGIFGIGFMNKLNSNSKEISDVWIKGITLADSLNKNLSDFRIQEYKYIETQDKETRKEISLEFDEILKLMNTYFSDYEPLCVSDEDKSLFNNALNSWNDYLSNHKKMIDILASSNEVNSQLKAIDIMDGSLEDLYDKTGSHFTTLVDFNRNGTDEIVNNADLQFKIILFILAVLILLILAFSIFLSLKVLNSIVTPINYIKDIAIKVANGDLSTKLNV